LSSSNLEKAVEDFLMSLVVMVILFSPLTY
jgi:hypothetical protein